MSIICLSVYLSIYTFIIIAIITIINCNLWALYPLINGKLIWDFLFQSLYHWWGAVETKAFGSERHKTRWKHAPGFSAFSRFSHFFIHSPIQQTYGVLAVFVLAVFLAEKELFKIMCYHHGTSIIEQRKR